jgi:hypothetical protein
MRLIDQKRQITIIAMIAVINHGRGNGPNVPTMATKRVKAAINKNRPITAPAIFFPVDFF